MKLEISLYLLGVLILCWRTNFKISHLLSYLLGILTLSLGISFTLISHLGAGGWDALAENIYKISGIKLGTCVILIALVLLTLVFLIKRKIEYKALIVSFLMGKSIDLCYYNLTGILKIDSFLMKLFILIIGLFLVGLGCVMMFNTSLPKNHTETANFSISDTLKCSYRKIKTITDVIAFVFAISLGYILKDFSNIGLGTILSSFFMGNIIHYIDIPYSKLIKQFKKN